MTPTDCPLRNRAARSVIHRPSRHRTRTCASAADAPDRAAAVTLSSAGGRSCRPSDEGSRASHLDAVSVTSWVSSSGPMTTSPGPSGQSGCSASPTSRARWAAPAKAGAMVRRKCFSSSSKTGRSGSRYNPSAPQVTPPTRPEPQDELLVPAHGSCSPATARCGWGRRRSPRAGWTVRPGSAARRRCSVPRLRPVRTRPRATPAGTRSMPSWKWLVTSSESGSTVYQHGVQ